MVASHKSCTSKKGLYLGAGPSGETQRRFKGVRMTSWGKWVSEIRLPNTRARLWLGSYATAHQAARAFDVAVVCLRGKSAALNFPDSPPVYAPLGLPAHQIQELAASAAAASPAVPSPSSPFPSSADSGCQLDMPLSSSPETSVICDESEGATDETNTSCSQCSSLVPSTLDDDAATFSELLLLDEDQSSALRRSFSFAALHDELLMGCDQWDQPLGGGTTFDSRVTVCVLTPFPVDDDDDEFAAGADQPYLWTL